MIHIRIDYEESNDRREFACGIGPDLPKGDGYVFESEVARHDCVDCPGCEPHKQELGTPLSQLSGRPGHPGHDKFKSIASSWGYD